MKRNPDGLVPAIVQDATTRRVLMMAWMDDEALRRTLTTRKGTYWSRSRRRYWVKGETSGNTQAVREVRLDCDGDTLLVVVDQTGPACHTGTDTCFDARLLLEDAGMSPEITIVPDLPGFLAAGAERRVVSVHARLQADDFTPVGLYHQLCGDRPNTFLLESAEGGVWSRYSFVGVSAVATLTESQGTATWLWRDRPIAGLPTGGDPLKVLAQTLELLHTPREADLPPLVSGMVGYLGYDVARRLERLPDSEPRRPRHPRTGDDAGLGDGCPRPPHRRGLAGGQRHQLRRHRRSHHRRLRRRL